MSRIQQCPPGLESSAIYLALRAQVFPQIGERANQGWVASAANCPLPVTKSCSACPRSTR
jgi:hypothetical protein